MTVFVVTIASVLIPLAVLDGFASPTPDQSLDEG